MWCCTLLWIFQIWTIIYWRLHLFLRLEDQIMWRTLVFTVDHEHLHPKLLPFRPRLTYDLTWEASKILGFSKVLKVQPLDICRNTSVLTGLSNLFSVSCMNCLYLTRIQKQESLCWAVSGGLLSKPPLSCTSRHSLGFCFHLNDGDTITPFPQECPRVAVLSWEH